MTRLLGMLGAGVAYFCIATVIAAVVLLVMFWQSGALSANKLARIREVFHDVDQPASPQAMPPLDAEQPSYEEIVEARAIKFRELELREEIVRQNVTLVQHEKAETTAQRQDFDRIKKQFDDELLAMENQALVAGEENVRQTIESIKPLQAKEQILRMLERDEIENVVAMLAAMPINKRAKIVAEFKAPPDAAKLSEILKLMGEGVPTTPLVDNALQPGAPDQPNPR